MRQKSLLGKHTGCDLTPFSFVRFLGGQTLLGEEIELFSNHPCTTTSIKYLR
jgi:hypothetical protein